LRSGTLGLKLAAVAAVTTVAGGWLAYVNLWRDTDERPLRYRDLTAQLHVEPTLSFARRLRRSDQLAVYLRRNAVAGA
jgi:hypothetical protein